MGFYLRKAFRAGPLRLNLSKGGLGLSGGLPGFRLGSGPRGNYVHMGMGGLYYRKFFRDNATTPQAVAASPNPPAVEADDVDVLALKDSSNEAFLTELNAKAGVMRWTPWWLALLAILIIAAFLVSGLVFIPLTVGAALAFPWVWQRDMERTTTTLLYDLDRKTEEVFGQLGELFASWDQYLVAEAKPIRSIPPRLATNVSPYRLQCLKYHFYFFPDQVLVRGPKGYGSVRYGDIGVRLGGHPGEGFTVPPGAYITGETWLYAKKDGDRDMRYKDNRQIFRFNSCLVEFGLPGGLELVVIVSGIDAANALPALVKRLGMLTEPVADARLD